MQYNACTCFRSPGSGHPSLQGWMICTEMPPACHLVHNMQFVGDIKLFFRVDRFILRRPSPLHMMCNSAICTVCGQHLLCQPSHQPSAPELLLHCKLGKKESLPCNILVDRMYVLCNSIFLSVEKKIIS